MKIKQLFLILSMAFAVATFAQQDQTILYQQDSITNKNNFIGLTYTLDVFSEIYKPRNLLTAAYQRKTSLGAFIARLGYADRFDTQDYNFELEAYPIINDKSYALLEFGKGFEKTLFPNYRFGAEYFRIFLKTYEASLGYKFLNFENRDINIYTGSISKYYGNYLFNARMFVTSSNGSTTNSYNAFVRRYFKDKYNFMTLNLGYGLFFEQINLADAFGNSYRIGVNSQTEIFKNMLLNLSFDYRSEELFFEPNNYVNRYTFLIGLTRRF